MRACSLICVVICLLIITDQFYRGFNPEKLFFGGFIVVAIWTDNSRWMLRQYRRKFCHKV